MMDGVRWDGVGWDGRQGGVKEEPQGRGSKGTHVWGAKSPGGGSHSTKGEGGVRGWGAQIPGGVHGAQRGPAFGVQNHKAGLTGCKGDLRLRCKTSSQGSWGAKRTRVWGAKSPGGAHGIQRGPAFGVQNHQVGLKGFKGDPRWR